MVDFGIVPDFMRWNLIGEQKMNHEQLDQTTDASGADVAGERKMSRREALAIVGKHAVYTAPAVLAVLSLTKSNSAHADGELS